MTFPQTNTVEPRRAEQEYLLAGDIDTSFTVDIKPANRIAYHCDCCGQVTDAGTCSRCGAKESS